MPSHQRRAVLDLGTNTFHLLIADVASDGTLTEIFRERRFVKLAAEGIERIGDRPFALGLEALAYFKQQLGHYGASQVRAFGTAALRTAGNGADFRAQAAAILGCPVVLISGDEEARLITLGVLRALPPLRERVLIMDIGGGSTEFIIAGAGGLCWRRSFPVGISVLFTSFHRNDPISPDEVATIDTHLQTMFAPLRAALAQFPTRQLVGAAGAFEVLADLLGSPAEALTSHAMRVDTAGFAAACDRLLATTLPERLADPAIPAQRADMLVVTLLLLRKVLELVDPNAVIVSTYALKEGALADF